MIEPETLQKYSLFGGLMEDQIESILPFMKQDVYEADEIIIAEGNPNDRIHFLIEGQVTVTKGTTELSRFSEGEVFGEMEVLDVMPAIASIKSLTKVTTLSISNKALREIYRKDVKIFALMLMNLARDLSRRLRKMDERLASSPVLI